MEFKTLLLDLGIKTVHIQVQIQPLLNGTMLHIPTDAPVVGDLMYIFIGIVGARVNMGETRHEKILNFCRIYD
jgi:hypothetical protein